MAAIKIIATAAPAAEMIRRNGVESTTVEAVEFGAVAAAEALAPLRILVYAVRFDPAET